MKTFFTTWKERRNQQGGVLGYSLLWLLGIPFPILLIVFLLRGCK